MARKSKWRHDEERVISVTPVGWGLRGPFVGIVVAVVLVVLGASHVHLLDEYRIVLAAVLVLPFLGVFLTRTWRWRSHKIHLTNQRIVVEGGVLQHTRSEVELQDLVTTRIVQHFRDRVARRGHVYVETPVGTLSLGVVRHPDALCRLIDNERRKFSVEDPAFDTVFDFDAPQDHDFDVSPRRFRGHRQ